VFRWHEAEAALGRKWSTDAIADCALDAGTLNTDLHGSAAYRAQLVRVMAAQAISRLN
jgi:carbon-monoxide dehydrogenase medium subunit